MVVVPTGKPVAYIPEECNPEECMPAPCKPVVPVVVVSLMTTFFSN